MAAGSLGLCFRLTLFKHLAVRILAHEFLRCINYPTVLDEIVLAQSWPVATTLTDFSRPRFPPKVMVMVA